MRRYLPDSSHWYRQNTFYPKDILLPLLRQTVRKVGEMTPAEAQTGPAARRDFNVMRKQMESLPNERLKEIYKVMSELIMNSEFRIQN